MHIQFETGDQTAAEAKGLVALLVALHGTAVLPPAHLAKSEPLTGGEDPKAPDGYADEPGTVEDAVNAADAFGAATTPAPAGDRDSAGTPWDERIHSSSKGTNKDGTWTRRRNTPDATYDAVMAELAGNAPAGTETVPAAPTTSAPAAPSDVSPPPPPAPETPVAPPPPPAPAADSPLTFPALMIKITKAQSEQKLTKDQVAEILAAAGVPTIVSIAQDPAKIAEVGAIVDGYIG